MVGGVVDGKGRLGSALCWEKGGGAFPCSRAHLQTALSRPRCSDHHDVVNRTSSNRSAGQKIEPRFDNSSNSLGFLGFAVSKRRLVFVSCGCVPLLLRVALTRCVLHLFCCACGFVQETAGTRAAAATKPAATKPAGPDADADAATNPRKSTARNVCALQVRELPAVAEGAWACAARLLSAMRVSKPVVRVVNRSTYVARPAPFSLCERLWIL